jgi:hypothetical protein
MAETRIPPAVAYTTYFQHSTPSLADGAFTKEVFTNGAAASNSNITVTYISGWTYAVTLASASFVATAGVYELAVSVTATPSSRWAETFEVTPDAIGASVASFTATPSNGRVMSGGSPLSGAVVTITRPGGALLAQASSNTSGVWGPVIFDANGTYPVQVQKSGYTIATASIVVSGGTATGPGADISLTGATSSSGTTASSLWAYARRMYKDHVGIKADTEIREAVDEALAMIATARDWPWYETVGQITLNAHYQTGTVTVTNGSSAVTLTGGTWPSWAGTFGEILLSDGLWYEVLTRDSGTQVTLTTPWAGTTGSGGAYTLAQMQYALPSDCRKIDSVVRSRFWVWGPEPVSRATLEVAKRTWISGASVAQLWSIERDRLVVWPYPEQAATINVLYSRAPAALTTGTDVADWDSVQIELLRRAIDYQIAARGDCAAGDRQTCLAAYKEVLSRAFDQDRTSQTHRVGLTSGGSPMEQLRYNSRIS